MLYSLGFCAAVRSCSTTLDGPVPRVRAKLWSNISPIDGSVFWFCQRGRHLSLNRVDPGKRSRNGAE
jgi:hypothetical protein